MNYGKVASKVQAGFAKYGVAITYTRPGKATANGAAGSVTPDVPTSYDGVYALSLPESKGPAAAFANRREDGSLRGAKLRYLKIAAASLPVEPQSDDTINFSGSDWLVLGCTPVDLTGSDPLIYGVGVMAL